MAAWCRGWRQKTTQVNPTCSRQRHTKQGVRRSTRQATTKARTRPTGEFVVRKVIAKPICCASVWLTTCLCRLYSAITGFEINDAAACGNSVCFTLFFRSCSSATSAAPDVPALWANCAAASLMLGNYRTALEEGSKAVKLDPTFARGHQRAAKALLTMGRLEEVRKVTS